MSDVYATAYVRVSGRTVPLGELLTDRALLASVRLADNPLGGVEFGSSADVYRIDDAVGFVVEVVLEAGRALLRAGLPVRYELRLSHGSETINVDGGRATADDGAGSWVSVPAAELADAFDVALAQYREAVALAQSGVPAG